MINEIADYETNNGVASLRAERSNPDLLFHYRDCFVPRNDGSGIFYSNLGMKFTKFLSS